MDDLYPSDFEALIGSLIVLMREEKDVNAKINANSDDIKRRVQEEIGPAEVPVDISQCTAAAATESTVEPPIHTEEELPEDDEMNSSAANTQESACPLSKKLFKQIALVTHPDKIKDEKLNKLFLLGRKAQEQNDILTLLFILSKCSPKNILLDSEIASIKTVLDERQSSIIKKKDTVTYKWHTYSEDVKKILIKKIV
jgi:hypothetical protein